MTQIKEQIRTPEKKKAKWNRDKEPIRCRIQNTGYKQTNKQKQKKPQHKTLVIKMLKELSADLNIKKTQSEVKHTLIEMKNKRSKMVEE